MFPSLWRNRRFAVLRATGAFTCCSRCHSSYPKENIVQTQSRHTSFGRSTLLQYPNTTVGINDYPNFLKKLQISTNKAFQTHQTAPANIFGCTGRVSKLIAQSRNTSTSSAPTLPSTSTQKMASTDSSSDGSPISTGATSPTQETPSGFPSTTPSFELTLAKHGLTVEDLRVIHSILMDIAMEGGKIMIEAEHSVLVAAQFKNNTSDLVTEFDKQIEDMVETRLRNAYPTFGFLGEESFKHGTKLSDTPTFVCDPIDGTLNFSKGVPNCAISLALTIDKKPVIGIVYNPFRGDLYHAIKGQGSYLTKTATGLQIKLPIQPISPPMPSLNSCLVAVEWGNQRQGENWALRTSVHNALLTSKAEGGAMCKSIRSNGSAALDFCYVAQGIIDVFWEGGVWIWDVCAGWIILEEAGGIVASANPGDWNPTLEGRLYFAVRRAEKEEQKAIVEELWGIMGERKFVY